MKKFVRTLLGLCVVLGSLGYVAAQEMSEGMTTPPPKVLVISREFVKPGKTGAIHEKSESAFVQAMTRAKSTSHYFALDSLSGKARCLFLSPYDSFDAWEKDMQATDKDAVLSAALDHAALADGELLSDYDQSVFVYSEEQSLRGPVDIAHMRYFEISLYHVRPGHRKDWGEILKLVTKAYEKIPSAHWAMYEAAYGQEGGVYAVFIPMKSAADIDESFTHDKDFMAAMGEDGMKKLSELESAAIESSQTNLFRIDPKMSYPPEAWGKTDPDFWKPKAMAPMAPKKPAEKPAGSQ